MRPRARGQEYVPGFDLGAIDRAADPCKDFYQYACGTWLKNNPIPADQASWGRFSELNERNQAILRDILEAAAKDANRSPDTQKIGDYYSGCMDEKTIDSKRLEPLQTDLDQIRAMSNVRDLSAEIGRLHRIGVNVLFNFSSGQDFKDSNAEIGQADQGGLGLPEKDYYFRTDAKAVETRKEYVAHITRMLTMMGVADPAKQADTIMRLETAMAKMSMDITARRDPANVYHKMSMAEFRALSDSFDWTRYFTAIDAPKMDSLNVASPDFFKGQEAMLKSVSMDDWKIYLAFHLIHGQAAMLPTNFNKENYNFYGTFLTGAKEQRPRWKRCVQAVDGDLGEALGKAYVDKNFRRGRQRAARLKMVRRYRKRRWVRIWTKFTWMTPETKKKSARVKAARRHQQDWLSG